MDQYCSRADKSGPWKRVKAMLETDPHNASFERAAVDFGFATLVAILRTCAFRLGRETKWSTDAPADPLLDCDWSDKQDYGAAGERRLIDLKEACDLKDLKLGFEISKVSRSKVYISPEHNEVHLRHMVDLYAVVKDGNSDVFRLPILLRSETPDMPPHMVVRASASATLLFCSQAMLLNTETGLFMLHSPFPWSTLTSMAHAHTMTNIASERGSKRVPVDGVPALRSLSSVVLISTLEYTLDVLILNSTFSPQTCMQFMISKGDVQFAELTVARRVRTSEKVCAL